MKKNYFLLPLEIRIRIQELCGSTQYGSERRLRLSAPTDPNLGFGSSSKIPDVGAVIWVLLL